MVFGARLLSPLLLCGAFLVQAQSPPPLIGLGDSLSEGVQSVDSNEFTQPHGYLNLVAAQMGAPFPLPLIKTSAIGSVASPAGRSRLNPSLQSPNLAVSGTDSTSILTGVAGMPIDDETDLVLTPRTGTQISIATSLHAPFTICWIGNNDILGTVTNFNHLDASQITPTPVFTSNYDQISTALGAFGGKVVYANIPDVTQVGFLFSRQDLIRFLGSDFGLPDGSYTTLIAMLLIKLGINDGSILQNPDWVLDPTEIHTIQAATATFNQIIAAHAAKINAPVVDIHGIFNAFGNNPLVIGNLTITNRYLGGIFSLDGLHPSDFGYALVADAFIQTIDSFYKMNIPLISPANLAGILLADPFVDFNGDLKVRGRFGAGLLESLGPFLGLSGDRQDAPVPAAPKIDRARGVQFMRHYFSLMGRDPNTTWTEADAIEAFRTVFHFGAK